MGKQNVVENVTRALITRKGTATGNLVVVHMMVSTYWYLLLVLGSGPTQSNINRSNGSAITDMGCRGATGTFWFGLSEL